MTVEILLWVVIFLGAVLIQALFINGVKGAMNGETEVLPNGKTRDRGMVLYTFYKWLTRTEEKKNIFYSGKAFQNFVTELVARYRMALPADYNNNTSGVIIYNTDAEIELVSQLAIIIRKEMKVMTCIDKRHVMFYKEYENYVYPAWFRKPFGQCIKCMASVYTVPVYWPVALVLFRWQPFLIPLYILNVACVSYVAYLIFKK